MTGTVQSQADLELELFGPEPEVEMDFDQGKSYLALPDKILPTPTNSSGQGKSSLVLPDKSLPTPTNSSGTLKTTATTSEFLLLFPALMDPRNFLKLITRYSVTDIVYWANHGRSDAILDNHDVSVLKVKTINLMSEHTCGGKDTLEKIIKIVKRHNRLIDADTRSIRNTRSNLRKKSNCASPEVTRKNIDTWYDCISKTTSKDLLKLPLYFKYTDKAKEKLTLLLGNNDYQHSSLILLELLHDPLFTYATLRDIPDDALLSLCVSHSYAHVLDKLKVNGSCGRVTDIDIKNRVENSFRRGSKKSESDYRKRQINGGHKAETLEENRRKSRLNTRCAHAMRADLYALLEQQVRRSVLGLPPKKPYECEIRDLIESIDNPPDLLDFALKQNTTIPASTLGKNTAAGVDVDADSDDEEMDDDDLQATIMLVGNALCPQ